MAALQWRYGHWLVVVVLSDAYARQARIATFRIGVGQCAIGAVWLADGNIGGVPRVDHLAGEYAMSTVVSVC